MSSLPIQIVNERDEPTGVATKQEAWEKGLIHRIVRIMLEDRDGNVLLQKRAADKELYPGCWDNSAAGHVDAGEDYETAAKRELHEELGLTLPLTEIGTYYVDFTWHDHLMKRFTKAYKAVIPSDTKLTFGEGEVAGAQWFAPAEVKKMLDEQPEQVTDGIEQVFTRYY